jgi:hypothetical protein
MCLVAARVNHRLSQPQLRAILSSPSGGVAKDLFRRGKKVEAAAKRNLQRFPRRINTGLLRSSIHTELVSLGGKPAVRIGTNVYYAIFVHEGTGLYGPKGAYIYPKIAQFLSWKSKKGRVFAKRTRGMRPNPFLKDALKAARD